MKVVNAKIANVFKDIANVTTIKNFVIRKYVDVRTAKIQNKVNSMNILDSSEFKMKKKKINKAELKR